MTHNDGKMTELKSNVSGKGCWETKSYERDDIYDTLSL